MRVSQNQPESFYQGIAGIVLKIVGVTAVGIAAVLMFTSPVRAETQAQPHHVAAMQAVQATMNTSVGAA